MNKFGENSPFIPQTSEHSSMLLGKCVRKLSRVLESSLRCFSPERSENKEIGKGKKVFTRIRNWHQHSTICESGKKK